MTTLQEQVHTVERRLAEARARIPKHDISPVLMAEIDELEEDLEALRAQARDPHARVKVLERRLAEARARIPKHDISPVLMAEIDDLEEALEAARMESGEEGSEN